MIPTTHRPLSMVKIQKGHCQLSFVIMNAASSGPMYGDRMINADRMLILRLSLINIDKVVRCEPRPTHAHERRTSL